MQPIANESELIARCLLEKDPRAFSILVQYYQEPVRQYCRRLCTSDFSVADDIAQESFMQAYRKLSLYQAKGKFLSWLLSIAYYQFLQHLRSQKKHQYVSDNDQSISESHTEEAPAKVSPLMAEEIAQEKDLETAISTLCNIERACITLQFSFGYTHQEISEMVSMPLGTVKSHIKRAKDRLTLLLQTQNADDNNLNQERTGAA